MDDSARGERGGGRGQQCEYAEGYSGAKEGPTLTLIQQIPAQAAQPVVPLHPHHWKWDTLYFVVFCAGQLLFMLKRADLARRSPLNGVKSIGHFFALNWVILLFRAALEWSVFYVYRFSSLSTIETLIQHLTSINIPMNFNRGLFGCFFVGTGSDGMLDWLTMQDKVLGVPIPQWVKENIPQIPQVTQLVATLPKQQESQDAVK